MNSIRQLITGFLTVVAILAGDPATTLAGNIPQYSFSKGSNKYAEFSDGTAIPCSFTSGYNYIYPNSVDPNGIDAEGFPIGFNFRFAGQEFDQFAISNFGNLYLGKGSVKTGDGSFRIGMTLVKSGLKSGNFSYKTTGEEGSRVLNFQLKKGTVNESSFPGSYSMQIRLFEADGKIEIALKELETVNGSWYGFDTGLKGWDGNDVIQLTADGLNDALSLSSKNYCNMLESDTFIAWDNNDYDNNYKPVIVFTPPVNAAPPVGAPQNLTLSQNVDALDIAVDRAEGADATVVLISEVPITEADMPVDGETFAAGTLFGSAKSLYYGNAEHISLTQQGLDPDKTYYVVALSANGYPNYNRTNFASATITTAQPAPTELSVAAVDENTVKINCKAAYPVIIASTTTPNPKYNSGYMGVFGAPDASAAAGDEIADGGKVIYVGNAGEFNTAVNPNELTFFRAWTLKGETVSPTSIDAYGISAPSLPYEPKLEDYPYFSNLEVWTATDGQFVPCHRAYDDSHALYAKTSDDAEVTLVSPALPLGKPFKVTFEYSLETMREPLQIGAASIPQGNKAGEFGDTGYLKVTVGGEAYKTISSYGGTMTASSDGYEDGSSTFEEVSVEIPSVGDGQSITIAFSVPSTSTLYLRGILVEECDPIAAPVSAPTNLKVSEDQDGYLTFTCNRGEDAEYTLVLFSESPISESDYPEDGVVPTAGSKTGKATVIYYGTDAQPSVYYTDFVTAFETKYYFAALSANGNPLFNRDNVAVIDYTTLPEGGDINSGINLIDAESTTDEPVYNLQGIRMTAPFRNLPAGLYICNGCKVVKK